MSKEIPILFSTPMVQAIIGGRKTMTRRIVKNVPDNLRGEITWGYSAFTPQKHISLRTKFKTKKGHNYGEKFFKKRWDIGDVLWVRETWAEVGMTEIFSGKKNKQIVYKAGRKVLTDDNIKAANYDMSKAKVTIGGGFDINPSGKWKPSIHMKKDYARIWLKVTGIKVERLQDITDGDVAKEGIVWNEPLDFKRDKRNCNSPAQRAFRKLWDKINGAESWNENPFVWAVEFKILSITGKGHPSDVIIFKDGKFTTPEWTQENEFLSNNPFREK